MRLLGWPPFYGEKAVYLCPKSTLENAKPDEDQLPMITGRLVPIIGSNMEKITLEKEYPLSREQCDGWDGE